MKLGILSDTHGRHDHVKVKPCDVLVHCGDCTNDIGQASLRAFLDWFERQPAPRKILIAGNHDGAFQKWGNLARAMVAERAPSVTYLEDSGCEIGGLHFWGSPWTPRFCDWHFNADRGAVIKRHWDLIPANIDVLITHGPPLLEPSVLDYSRFSKEHTGCHDLREAVERIQPQIHSFGHIHGGYGRLEKDWGGGKVTTFIIASCCNEAYHPVNPVHYIEIGSP